MSDYPEYVERMLAQARNVAQYYCGQAAAASLCFDALASFPDHREASALVYELFCDEWLIYDNRNAIQQNIDEWDDRPWQQRRRLALSFRFMSEWVGWRREYEDGHEIEKDGPPDVAALLDQGRSELLNAYCLGDEECTDFAWPIFMQAIKQTSKPYYALLWVAKQYADLGFFADATEVLLELCGRFDDASPRRLLAEVRWWRDNAYRLPWLPPAGDGSRYRRMMRFIDPNAPSDEEQIRRLRSRMQERRDSPDRKPVIDSELAALFAEALPAESDMPGCKPLVDWSFLDTDDGQPGEVPDWVKKQMRLFPKHAEEIKQMHLWSRPIKPPSTPPRRDPNDTPFDPGEFGMDDDDLDFYYDDDDDDDTEPDVF
ncbi:MAG: hypothetical protein HY782_02610 [Chloroflexi bacterium]|nr:hypothetical protein [Chloroflexota bacterium]